MAQYKIKVTQLGGEEFTVETAFLDEIEWEKYAAREDIPLFNAKGGAAAPSIYFSHMAYTAARRALVDVPDTFDVFVATVEEVSLERLGPKGKAPKSGRREDTSG